MEAWEIADSLGIILICLTELDSVSESSLPRFRANIVGILAYILVFSAWIKGDLSLRFKVDLILNYFAFSLSIAGIWIREIRLRVPRSILPFCALDEAPRPDIFVARLETAGF